MTNRIDMLVVEPNGSVRKVNDLADLDTLRGLVGGGWLEGVSPDGRWTPRWMAYVDEEGKIKGLPINVAATTLAKRLGWPEGDYLVGTVVFVGPADEEGDDTDVPDLVVREAITAAGLR